MGVFGDTLRQARAQKGVTLKEAEQATRISRHHLAALEDEQFALLPALIYQRGIVRNYATYLDLDAGKLLAMFEEARGGDPTPEIGTIVRAPEVPSHWAPNFAIIAFMVVMSAIIFTWVYSLTFAPGDETPQPTLPPATVTLVPQESLQLFTPSPAPATPAAALGVTPTPRVILPVETPTPTVRPIVTPTPTATVPPPTPTEEVVVAQQPVEEAPPEEPAQPPPGSLQVMFTADDYLYLSVTVDGVLMFDQNLAPGQSTWLIPGQLFEVYTSNAGATKIVVNGGEPFVMGYDNTEMSFTLP